MWAEKRRMDGSQELKGDEKYVTLNQGSKIIHSEDLWAK